MYRKVPLQAKFDLIMNDYVTNFPVSAITQFKILEKNRVLQTKLTC